LPRAALGFLRFALTRRPGASLLVAFVRAGPLLAVVARTIRALPVAVALRARLLAIPVTLGAGLIAVPLAFRTGLLTVPVPPGRGLVTIPLAIGAGPLLAVAALLLGLLAILVGASPLLALGARCRPLSLVTGGLRSGARAIRAAASLFLPGFRAGSAGRARRRIAAFLPGSGLGTARG
jgi:hypothetical protein